MSGSASGTTAGDAAMMPMPVPTTTASAGKDAAPPHDGASETAPEPDAATAHDAAAAHDATVADSGAAKHDAAAGEGGATNDAAPPENDAADPGFQCSQGAPCDGTSECSVSEGVGLGACDLICSCDNTGLLDCSQSCPPDAGPPATCAPGVVCVPGVRCGGEPPMCLCDNTGHLECASGYDGGP